MGKTLIHGNQDQPPSAEAFRRVFDAAPELRVGIEEEVMLLDPATLELAPRAPELVSRLDESNRFKLELPASQVEILSEPERTATAAMTAIQAGRRKLAARAEGRLRPAAAGVSPLGSGEGELNDLPRYERTITEYGWVARRQLVCAHQVHVSLTGADRALEVYNAARSYLPLIAALAANGAYYRGEDTGFASVRPKLAELLPRQGVPPAFGTCEEYAAALRWGADSGALPHPGAWWWELRLHPGVGTLEFRVPDAQSTVADGAAITAVIQLLVAWLAQRRDSGERLPAEATWKIEENRWSAARHGVEGEMADLATGARASTRELLGQLLEALAPLAAPFGAELALDRASGLVEVNGAMAQRAAGRNGGAAAVAAWLAERFLEPWVG
jgi:glutamate---cysteine ligase / carboxylate-amine ligase